MQQKVLFKLCTVTHLNCVSTHNYHHLVLFSLQTPLFSYTPLSGVSLAGTADTLSRLHKEHASPLSLYQYFPQKSVKKEVMQRTSPRIIQVVDRNLTVHCLTHHQHTKLWSRWSRLALCNSGTRTTFKIRGQR